jgi:hypothetical protein
MLLVAERVLKLSSQRVSQWWEFFRIARGLRGELGDKEDNAEALIDAG